jgi:hypothetical protein
MLAQRQAVRERRTNTLVVQIEELDAVVAHEISEPYCSTVGLWCSSGWTPQGYIQSNEGNLPKGVAEKAAIAVAPATPETATRSSLRLLSGACARTNE